MSSVTQIDMTYGHLVPDSEQYFRRLRQLRRGPSRRGFKAMKMHPRKNWMPIGFALIAGLGARLFGAGTDVTVGCDRRGARRRLHGCPQHRSVRAKPTKRLGHVSAT